MIKLGNGNKMTINPERLKEYVEHIKADYAAWRPAKDEITRRMIDEFDSSIKVDVGSKFLRVIRGGSVHSFICMNDMGKFVKGDILKAASWRAPAKNFPRGNVELGQWQGVRWTGA